MRSPAVMKEVSKDGGEPVEKKGGAGGDIWKGGHLRGLGLGGLLQHQSVTGRRMCSEKDWGK